jgi:hypothetical protein
MPYDLLSVKPANWASLVVLNSILLRNAISIKATFDSLRLFTFYFLVMRSDTERIQVDFHNSADALYFSLLRAFEADVKGINRKTQEYLFQQKKATYCNTFKKQLENRAEQLIEKHGQNQTAENPDQSLQYSIKQYLHLFVQKTRTL